jgi:uncharacterized membrane protein YqjE
LADRPSSSESSSDPSSGKDAQDAQSAPPGLGEQFGRTRSAFVGLISSHVNLAKAEFGEIGGQIKRAAALGGIALLLLFLAAILTTIGTVLFVDEALFHSIGWGVLHGSELFIGVAALLVMAVIDLGWARAFSAFVVALIVGLVVVGVLGVDWAAVSRSNSGLPGPLVLGLLAGALAFGLLGLALGASFGRGVAAAGLLLGVVLGLLLGWLASAGPGLRVAIALGVAALLLFWPLCAAVLVFRHGIDMGKLKDRFVPVQTIATTKETIEWVREQMPLGRKS